MITRKPRTEWSPLREEKLLGRKKPEGFQDVNDAPLLHMDSGDLMSILYYILNIYISCTLLYLCYAVSNYF